MFDYHGVVFTRVNVSFRERAAKKYGISEKLYNETFYSKSSLGRKFRNGKLTKKQFIIVLGKKLGFTKKLTKKLAEDMKKQPVPNKKVFSLVKKLNKKYPVYMFSGNMRDRAIYTNKKYHFRKLFKKCFFSFDMGCNKDSLEFYRKAFNKLPYKPNETVLVDDLTRFTKVAKKFGMKTILFKDARQTERALQKLDVQI